MTKIQVSFERDDVFSCHPMESYGVAWGGRRGSNHFHDALRVTHVHIPGLRGK